MARLGWKCNGACSTMTYPKGHNNFMLSKRCHTCRIWVNPIYTYCPCCNIMLRIKPRIKVTKYQKEAYQQKIILSPWEVSTDDKC